MEKANQLYQDAIELLQQADERHGVENEAEQKLRMIIKILSPSFNEPQRKKAKHNNTNSDKIDKEEEKYFLAEIYLLLGRIIEWKQPNLALIEYTNAYNIVPNIPETNYNVARLKWKQATTINDMNIAEERLRDTIKLAEESEDEHDEIYWDNANELLGRLLCQSGSQRRQEAFEVLTDLKYKYVFQAHLTSIGNNSNNNNNNNIKNRQCNKKNLADDNNIEEYVAAFNDVLPDDIFNMMTNGFKLNARFWKENNYGDPRTGFFSFQHKLPSYTSTLKAHENNQYQSSSSSSTTRTISGLDQMLQYIWIVTSKAMPKVKNAKYVEWWAHSRQHCYGHQIHYDSIPGKKKGKPKHPLISTITFLKADCGGPTLVTDQTIENKKTTKGWVAHPKTNRLICFNGSALHLVLPGAGHSPQKDARRTTFMAAFWDENPHHGVEFETLLTNNEGNSSSSSSNNNNNNNNTNASEIHINWPKDFPMLLASKQNNDKKNKKKNKYQRTVENDAITQLKIDEICEVVPNNRDKSLLDISIDNNGGIDLMSDSIFTSCEGLLGLGMKSDRQEY